MNPLSPIFAFLLFVCCFISAFVLNHFYKISHSGNRFTSIDGLRGFLAIAVFMHHAVIWHNYLHTSIWTVPRSNLYIHLGQTAVTFFFMISSFLFVNRLIEFKGLNYNWKVFFIKRFLRLGPLHFFGVLLIVLIVFLKSEWIVYSSPFQLVVDIARWVGFGILEVTDINEFEQTFVVNAGVLWSLPYEWLLYMMLPMISVFFIKGEFPYFYILVGMLFVVIAFQFRTFSPNHILSFAAGGLAALLLEYKPKILDAEHWIFSVLAIICLIGIIQFSAANNIFCKVLTSLFFTIVALGNSIFGILNSKSLLFLGEISYSTYLLHGIILYVFLDIFVGRDFLVSLEPYQYCLLIAAVSPVIIAVSFVSYFTIEKAGMNYSKRIIGEK